ncbi:MAG: branched-chain amino acid ABC transporter permease [Desulfurococcales archaeon]|nr:branched-chain amino acid ABC transporter permease [Desulfurococcales archaeon]
MDPEILASAILDGLLIGGAYALVAMGLAMIWGVMEIINFAHGDFMMLGALFTFFLFTTAGLDPIVSALISFAPIFALGVMVQRGVINKILDAPLLTQIAATFAILLIIRYGVQAAFGPYTRRLVSGYSDIYINLGFTTIPLPKVIIFATSLIVLGLLYVLLHQTDLGIAIRATSQDRRVAQLMGINVSRIYDVTFGIGVGVAAIGGGLIALFYPIFPEMGGFFALIAFIAVVLGGFGSVYGAYAGGLIIGVAESVSALFIEPALKDVVAFLIFIMIILVKPTGLFGRGD